MSELKPSVAQMLQVAHGCGLRTLEEAYNNYMSHYDCFFLIEKFHEQNLTFIQELKDCGFTEEIDGVNELINIHIDTCARILGIKLYDYEEQEPTECPPFHTEELFAQPYDIEPPGS